MSIKYRETDEYEEGKILEQSRKPESTVAKKGNLTITVAKKPSTEQPNPDDGELE